MLKARMIHICLTIYILGPLASLASAQDNPALKDSFPKAATAKPKDREASEKTVLKETLAKASLPAEIEVYPAMHGWCPPDLPAYNQPQSEKAWGRLLALYEKALA